MKDEVHMQKACPLSELAPGDALPAKLPVCHHEVKVVDGDIMVIESSEAPNLPPGLTPQGRI